MSRTSSPTASHIKSAATKHAAKQPLGSRPPAPNWSLIGLRCLVVACLLLASARGPLLCWADAQPRLPARPTVPLGTPARPAATPAATVPFPQRLSALGARVVHVILRPPVYLGIWGVGLLGLSALGLELLLASGLLVIQSLQMRRTGSVYLRVRTPQLATPRASGGSYQSVGEDLFRAAHELLPVSGMATGVAPWLTFVLVGQPDEPATLGVAVGAPARDRPVWAGALRKILIGQVAEAVVDPAPDPLQAALLPGRLLAWREFGLVQPPSYPLRFHDDVARSDLLGPLAAALQPRSGVVHTELQLILRPRHDWDLQRGWRAGALRRLLRLKARQRYGLSDDAKTLEAKLDGPVYDTTLRMLVIGADRHQRRAAQAELDEATAVLGQYAARSGSRLQRLIRIGAGQLVVPPTTSTPWVRMVTGLVGVVGAGIGLALRQVLSMDWAGRWPLLALPPAVASMLPWLLSQLLPLLGGLLALALAQRQRGVPAAVRLQQLCARTPRALPLAPALLPFRAWRGPAILAPHELSGLWHLPTPALGQLVRWLPCRHLPAPPQAFANQEPNRLIVGIARHRDGTEAPVGPTFADGRQGIAFTAPPGVGKTQLASNLCDQFRALGYLLLDGKGDDSGNLVETMRARIPTADEDRLILLDVLDADWPIGINPLAGLDRANAFSLDRVLGQIESIFARLDPDTWGKAPRMKQFLRMATLLVVQSEPHPTLAHIKQALVDDRYRAQLLQTTTNVEVTTFWQITYPQAGESQRTSRDALLSRFDMLLVPETARYLFNQATPALRFAEAIAQRQIVLCPIPHRALGGLAAPIGMLVFQAFLQAAFARPGSDRERVEYGLVCDEFQVLIEHSDTKDVRDALTQVRAFGIVTVIANQLLTQLGDLAAYALTAIANRIILHTQEPDASTYAAHYQASGLSAMDISGQEPREHQYARLMCRDMPAGPFSMRPLPWLPAIPADAPPDDGPAWQTIRPPGSPTPTFDKAILALVYTTHADPHAVAQALAAGTEAQWAALLIRWDAIRATQRRYILAHPGCIPDRLSRQVWLSRLTAARPRVLAMAEYARIRRALNVEATPDAGGRRSAALAHGSGQGAQVHAASGTAEPTASQQAHFAELDIQPAPSTQRIEPADLQIADLDDQDTAEGSP